MSVTRPAAAAALRSVRKACGLGQEQWAAFVGVSRKTVQRWEAGEGVPDARAEQAIAEICRERDAFSALTELVPDEGTLNRILAAGRVDRRSSPAAERASDPDLVGRRAELDTIRFVLGEARLVTLTGPAGVGKTRLAFAAAAESTEPVRIVQLAPLHDPALILSAIADAVGARQGRNVSLADSVQAKLGRLNLLVVDNCEHLEGIDGVVDDLLVACPELTILATSRRSLRLPAEHELTVRPLAPADALELFVRRARTARADFDVTDTNRPAVATLCSRLDRLPLAIELAAARTRVVSPQMMLGRIDARLELLADRKAASDERHRSLRAALEWSNELLDRESAQLFRSLAVFAGPFAFPAVEAISDQQQATVLAAIEDLLDDNLLQPAESAESEPRFEMLESIRAFASELLAAADEEDEVRARHAGYFAEVVARHSSDMHGPGQAAGLDSLQADYANIRGCLQWQLEHDPSSGLVTAIGLADYWDTRSALAEGRDWLHAMLGAATDASWATIATATNWASYLAGQQGDVLAVETLANDALALWDEHGVEQGRGYAMLMLAHACIERGDLDDGERFLEKSSSAFETVGDQWGAARAHNNLGEVARMRHDLGKAAELHERALSTCRSIGDLGGRPNILCGLGHVRLLQGDLPAAIAAGREAVETSEVLGNRLATASGLELVGLARLRDDPIGAGRVLGAAHALREELGAPPETRDRDQLRKAREHGPAFDDGWLAGTETSLDEIVSDVLGASATRADPP